MYWGGYIAVLEIAVRQGQRRHEDSSGIMWDLRPVINQLLDVQRPLCSLEGL